MVENVKLKADDGHELDAYLSHPDGKPIAGLVVFYRKPLASTDISAPSRMVTQRTAF
jgi:hypothetical protein